MMRFLLMAITVIGLGVAWNCASDPPLPSETDTTELAEGKPHGEILGGP